MMSIDDPVALAVMEWLSPQAGGRRSGPPSWPYAATCDFLEEDMRHHPGHSESPGYTMSIVLEPTELVSVTVWKVKIDFLVRELVLPCLWPGRYIIIREGGRVAAVAMITDVLVEIT